VLLEQTLKISLSFAFLYFIYSKDLKEDFYFFESTFMSLFSDALTVHFYLFKFFSAKPQEPFAASDEACLPVIR
jgi:hypothetical protein